MGMLFRRLHQPAVVGEIIAGIALGPSLLGALPGHLDRHLFPLQVQPFLNIIAQVGLVIFMFIVGLELDLKLIRGKERTAATVSLSIDRAPVRARLRAGRHPLRHAHDRRGQDDRLPAVRGLPRSLDVGHRVPGAGSDSQRTRHVPNLDRRPRAGLRRSRRRPGLVAARHRGRGGRRQRRVGLPADHLGVGCVRDADDPRRAPPAATTRHLVPPTGLTPSCSRSSSSGSSSPPTSPSGSGSTRSSARSSSGRSCPARTRPRWSATSSSGSRA